MEPSGSTSAQKTFGLTFLTARVMPVKVPAEPQPKTSASMRPSVCSMISRAVVSSWKSGLAGFSNCCGMKLPGVSAASSRARRTAPSMPSSAGTYSTRPPSASMIFIFSREYPSGTQSTTR